MERLKSKCQSALKIGQLRAGQLTRSVVFQERIARGACYSENIFNATKGIIVTGGPSVGISI